MPKKFSLVGISLVLLSLTLFLTIFVWKIVPQYLFISLQKGFFVACDIFLIIFGAIFFIEILKKERILESIGFYLERFSKDIRIQVIFLAWFLENLIEGIAGFGSPSAIVAPLLIGLGISPINAVVISLFGNSSAGAFGAAGTPIRIGLAGVAVPAVNFYTALFNFSAILVPTFILLALSHGKKDKISFIKGALPFALWSGFVFWIFSFMGTFLGGEFPTIVGSLLGLLVAVLTLKLNIFVPKDVFRHEDRESPKARHSLIMALFPYLLVVTLLIGGKFLSSGFNPGFALIVSGLIVFVITRKKVDRTVSQSFKLAFVRTVEPFVVIFAMSATVQLILNSGNNYSGNSSILRLVSGIFENNHLPFLAPFAGAFGSFVSGSVTISNILFGNFLAMASNVMKMSTAKVLGLQVAGAAAGNMLALADVLTAEAVAGLKNKEVEIIKRVFVPCLIYVVLTGIAGLLFV
ncbi:L-lactate permease [Candidatus Parcubacteria bacterium]|nr:L-lactate permease [Patescibacteria group bacterium]MBU4380801.1 L-lactate permease [Patescibacteria group bacterium]MCG2689105.1 L-lactate permease [Candidatus Parcubacteria bacterium]